MSTTTPASLTNGRNGHSNGASYRTPPQFLEPLTGPGTSVVEGEALHLQTGVGPLTNEEKDLQVDWIKDGLPLLAGSRFNTVCDRGYISFDILYTISEDSGEYSCRVLTSSGVIQSNVVAVEVKAEPAVLQQDQNGHQAELSYERRSPVHHRNGAEVDKHQPKTPPCFLTCLPAEQTTLVEGDTLRIVLILEPSKDASMSVQWLKNWVKLNTGSRINCLHERDACILEIRDCIPEDSGLYCCLAKNALGDATSSTLDFLCIESASVVTESNLLEDSEGFRRIQEFENELYSRENGIGDFRYVEDQEAEMAPCFVTSLNDTTSCEGFPAKFLVKVSGYPRPQIAWTLNGVPIVENSVTHIYNDGAISYLEIHRCSQLGSNTIQVIASNELGQIESEAKFDVLPIEDFRPDLKHITPENPYKKLIQLKKVEISKELQSQLSRPKPSAQEIFTLEQEAYSRNKQFYKEDVFQTEQLYDQVASLLRRCDIIATTNEDATASFEFDKACDD